MQKDILHEIYAHITLVSNLRSTICNILHDVNDDERPRDLSIVVLSCKNYGGMVRISYMR